MDGDPKARSRVMTATAFPHVESGEKYARDVIAGKIPACKWVRLACERHVADLKQKRWRWTFNPSLAERKMKFAELFPHTKGKWAAKKEPFVLQPWQCFGWMSIFGWVDKKEPTVRRFTRAMWMTPRKNGKSDNGARLGLAMMADDNEHGAEVYCGATSEKQAWEVFGPARKMAALTPEFQEFYGVEVMKSNLHIPANGSKFEPVIGKPGDGASPSCAIVDEYHEHPDDTLLDTMETGMGARERPLCLIPTTAGDNLGGPCYAMQKELEKILEGVVENERFFGLIYTIDDGDDPFSVEALKKANPNYGVSVSAEFLQDKLKEAIRNSRKQGVYKTKHLNIWVGARQAFFNMRSWGQCAKPGMQPEDYKGRRLYVGLDLMSTIDIAAVSLLFELDGDRWASFVRCYIPEARVEGGENEHYAGWAADGHLIVTDGNMIDYDRIEADIVEIHETFGISELGFDPAYAGQMVQHLMSEGITCVDIRPTVLNFSAPMKHMEGLVLAGKIEHPDNPCVNWQMANVVSKTDQKDNVYPNKEKPESKIDAAVATLMAMNRGMLALQVEEPTYEVTII
jgi:phage terminase large subunit-like protein